MTALSQPVLADAPTPTRHSARLVQFDSLRGLAALFVVFHHACLTCWQFPAVAISPALAPWLGWLKYGHFSVTLFIVLSGFVIMRPLVSEVRSPSPRRLWRSFFQRRAFRILPPYYVALACSLALLVWFHGWKGLRFPDIVGHLLLVHDWGVGAYLSINGPMWSIPVEWHIYFLVPLVFLGWRKIGVVATTLLALVIGYAVFWLIPDPVLRDSAAPHFYAIFVLGGAAAIVASHIETGVIRAPSSPGTIVLAAGVIWAASTFIPSWDSFLQNYAWCDLTFAVFASLALVFLAIEASWLRRLLSFRPLVGLGTMSYSLYLIHGPLLGYFDGKFAGKHGIPADRKFMLLSFVAVPIILVAAYIFHRVVERPFLAWRPVSAKVPHGLDSAQVGAPSHSDAASVRATWVGNEEKPVRC
ncbi:MAG TPA: acyltransferase [Opitutaceae bacterium]|nr:acyltransferase [Opitutaceae bacterium]